MASISKLGKITAVALLGMTLALFAQPASAQGARVDLILEGGTVLIYKGKEAGFTEGQKLEVVRGGKVVGNLEVSKMTAHFTQANIVSGAREIQELDTVRAVAADAKETKTEKQAEPSSEKKTETKEETAKPAEESAAPAAASSRRGRGSAAAAEPAAAEPAAPAAASSRRGRGSAATAAAEPEPAAAEPAASGRRGRGTTSSAPADETSAQTEAPLTLGREPFYSLHVGYMFLKHDLPGNVSGDSNAISLGVDYWAHRKKTENDYIVYSLLYSRPVASTVYNGQTFRYQLKITELSVNYIRDGLSGLGANRGMYAGVGVGYRSAKSQANASITYDGVSHFVKKSMDGIDYHGIIGARFSDKMELKFNYCFDEKYYVIDAGYKF